LTIGHDFFNDGFGRRRGTCYRVDPDTKAMLAVPMTAEDLAHNEHIDEAMRRAWKDPSVRQRCYAELAGRQAHGASLDLKRPWAEQRFCGDETGAGEAPE